MNHIPTFEEFNNRELRENSTLIQETYDILEGQVSYEELSEILNEGIFSFLKGIFTNPRQKKQLDKLGEDLFKTKVELQKLEIEEDQIDRFKDDLKPGTKEYSTAQSKIKIADKAKGLKINALRDRETSIVSQMDSIGEKNDTLKKYVDKVKLEIRMRANDATIKLADAEMARVLKQLQRKDAKEVKVLDRELAKAA